MHYCWRSLITVRGGTRRTPGIEPYDLIRSSRIPGRLSPTRNVWSAASPQAKSGGGVLVCANVYGLCWSVLLLAMMECAALCSSLNRQSCEDCFTPQVWRAPGSTVEPSHYSPADLAGKHKLRSRRWAVDVGIAPAISKPG